MKCSISEPALRFTGQASQPELRQAFEQGARVVGKNPASMPTLVGHLVVVGTRQEAERWAPLWRFGPKAGTYLTDPDPRSIQCRAEAEVPLEQVTSQWLVSEDPEAHLQALPEVMKSGVTQIFVHSPQPDQAKVIRFYGEQVLPRLSQAPLAGSRR